MAKTIGDSISRLRNLIKAVKEDAFITDRFLYSLVIKHAKYLIKRQDNENKLMRLDSVFEVLPCLELIEVDKIEACCTGIKTNCTIKRTKDKLPEILEGIYGPLFRSITSIDRSIGIYKTYPSTYSSMTSTTTFKYNKNKYYWYIDGHLYFPDLEWDGVLVEGMWLDDVAHLKCDEPLCTLRQDGKFAIPDYLFAEIEQLAMQDLGLFIRVPTEGQDDNQSQLRS